MPFQLVTRIVQCNSAAWVIFACETMLGTGLVSFLAGCDN